MKIDVLTTFSSSMIFSLNIFAMLLLQGNVVASTSHAILKGNYVKKQKNRYEIRDFVTCLDEMFIKKNQSLHFAFLGDSLVRNQFLNLVSLIPDYDRNMPFHLKEYESHFHEDRNMSSQLLNGLLLSFRWRAIINDQLISDFKLWTIFEDHKTPNVIFLGSTVHNMLQNNYGRKDISFLETLEKELLPVLLDYLNAHPNRQVFWIIQNPTTDLLGSVSEQNNYIVNVKRIHHFNNIVRQILTGTRVMIWESFLPFVEEYIRSCFLLNFYRYDAGGYELCDDYIHPGQKVLSMSSQLIINLICRSIG